MLRKERALSQEKLADASGCTRTYVSLLETGRYSPSLALLLELARALEIRPGELLDRTVALLASEPS